MGGNAWVAAVSQEPPSLSGLDDLRSSTHSVGMSLNNLVLSEKDRRMVFSDGPGLED